MSRAVRKMKLYSTWSMEHDLTESCQQMDPLEWSDARAGSHRCSAQLSLAWRVRRERVASKLLTSQVFHYHPHHPSLPAMFWHNSPQSLLFTLLVIVCLHSTLAVASTGSLGRFNMGERVTNSSGTSSSKSAMTNMMLANKQPAPKFTWVVWDENGMVCILAKFEATIIITFDTPSGPQQLIEKIPPDASAKGRCDTFLDEKPVIDVYWIGGFTFRISFEKIEENKWGVNSLDLVYNTADSLFRGAVRGGKKVARSPEHSLDIFTTPMGKSYFCPSPPVMNLYESKSDKPSVVVRFTNVRLQAFQIEMGNFAPISRCSQVSFGSGVPAPLYVSLEQDDSVPVVVGTLTVIVSILVIVGYAVYKSWVFKQVDYDNMI